MIIRAKLSFAGMNFSYCSGDIVDIADEQAAHYIELGYVEPINYVPVFEATDASGYETTSKNPVNTGKKAKHG